MFTNAKKNSWFCDNSIFFLATRFFFPATRSFFLTARKKFLCQRKKFTVRKKLNCHKIKKKIIGIRNHFCESGLAETFTNGTS